MSVLTPAPELLTARELAARLKVSVWSIHNWRRGKKIPSVRLGTQTFRYVLADVLKALEGKK